MGACIKPVLNSAKACCMFVAGNQNRTSHFLLLAKPVAKVVFAPNWISSFPPTHTHTDGL